MHGKRLADSELTSHFSSAVHRSRQNQHPRPDCQISRRPRQGFRKGCPTRQDPLRTLALRLGQAADCPGIDQAHRQPRQGGRCQELLVDPCGEQQTRCTRGRRGEVWRVDGRI